MLTISSQIGISPLSTHQPTYIHRHPSFPFIFSVGKNGDIIAWDNMKPIYAMLPSLNCDAGSVVDIVNVEMVGVEEDGKSGRIITIHEDGRFRVWDASDGTCLNVSGHGVLQNKCIKLIAPLTPCKFILVLHTESVSILDLWTLRTLSTTICPPKQPFALFNFGRITPEFDLQLWDNQGKEYRMKVARIFQEQWLDVGRYLGDMDIIQKEIKNVVEQVGKSKTESFYAKRQQKQEFVQELKEMRSIIQNSKHQSLAEYILQPSIKSMWPELVELLSQHPPSVSSLTYLPPGRLYFIIGTESGSLVILPAIITKKNSISIVSQPRKDNVQSPVRLIRIESTMMIVSWEDGLMQIYNIQNIGAFLIQNTNTQSQNINEVAPKIFTTDILKLLLHGQKLSSPIKSPVRILSPFSSSKSSLLCYRLLNNEVITLRPQSLAVHHFRGISGKIYCIFLLYDYVAVCWEGGVEMYDGQRWERRINYEDWDWNDWQLETKGFSNEVLADTYDYDYKCKSGNSLIKFNCRYVTDKLKYYSDSSSLLPETFGKNLPTPTTPVPYFHQLPSIQSSLHSPSPITCTISLALKHAPLIHSSFCTQSFILLTEMNSELQAPIGRKQINQAIEERWEVLGRMGWFQGNVPCLEEIQRNCNRMWLLNYRYAMQGVGKSFTIHFLPQYFRQQLSDKMLVYDAISSIAFLQLCVLKNIDLTDDMVEVVEHYSTICRQLFPSSPALTLPRMAVSDSQAICKATLNVLMSKMMKQEIKLHPVVDYFVMNIKIMEEKKRKLMSYNETVWMVYLGMGIIFNQQKVGSIALQQKLIIDRILQVIELENFIYKPNYVLIAMKILNEGLSKWQSILTPASITKFLINLFYIFFLYDGLSNVPPDDKKFNFCFASLDPNKIKTMKQSIVKTVIYVAKEFPHQFHQVLKNQSVNQKVHLYYPASVVELLRQFIKSEKPTTHLVFFVQLLLQCLSPMTPNLRKVIQKSALATLRTFVENNPSISFNQPSQKLSVKTANHLYIYCLRTSTKWRTINLKQEKDKKTDVSLIKMSPQGTYIALLSDKLRVWRLSSGFWSGVLGAFSQDWVFEATGYDIVWQQNEASITVLNENPTLNKVIRL